MQAEAKPITETRVSSNDIYSKEGELIGSVVKTHDVEVIESDNGTHTIVTTFKDYTLLPQYDHDVNYTSVFKDETTTTEIFYDNINQEILVNGDTFSVNELSDLTIRPLSEDTGGIPALCHYYSTNNMSLYTFKSYESMNYNWVGEGNGHGEPEGSHVSRELVPVSNIWFAVAKNGVDLFDSSYSDFRSSYAQLLVEAAAIGWLGAIFVWTPAGWIAGAAPLAVTAGVTIANFNSAKSDLNKAYNYIVKL